MSSILGVGLSQISEFGFVLASRAIAMDLISKEAYYLFIGTTSLSLIISAILWRVLRISESLDYRAINLSDHTSGHDASPLLTADPMRRTSSKSNISSSNERRSSLPFFVLPVRRDDVLTDARQKKREVSAMRAFHADASRRIGTNTKPNGS
jgi:hypothetical protein